MPSPDLLKVAQEQCEALALRMVEQRQYARPGQAASPAVVHQALLDVRARLDAAEAIVQDATAMRSAARTVAAELKALSDDAWAMSIVRLRQQGVQRDYEGARERYAQADLASFEELRRARVAQQVADLTQEMYDHVFVSFRGLRDVREELIASLRYLQFETVLER